MRYAEGNALRRLSRSLPSNASVAEAYARILPALDRSVFRLTHGRHTLASLVAGLPIILLETTGARSGQPRAAPLVGIPDGNEVVVVASNWGKEHHPAWYHNLRAHPTAMVTIKGERRLMRARVLSGEERDRRWRQALDFYPAWDAYARRAQHREIPILVLEPERGGA